MQRIVDLTPIPMKYIATFLTTVFFAISGLEATPIKVFILAGQSNMEGKAPNTLLDHQATDPKTKDIFAHLRKNDQWIVRDDVFIKFLDRKGPLTVGFGSPDRTGAELEFGTMMGDHFQEHVLLIKTAWGGKSLAMDFRPPGSGDPSAEILAAQVKAENDNLANKHKATKKDTPAPTVTAEETKAKYGYYYREMLKEVNTCLSELSQQFPDCKGEGYEIAGFIWFQGWNDFCNAEYVAQYEKNMANLILDVRKDLKLPKLPVVIAVMGQNMSKPAEGRMLQVQQAQLAMNDVPEFKGNVKAFRTDVLVDKAAEALYPDWRKDVEKWKLVGGDHAYHYLGSAIWFSRIGHAMGDEMKDLLKQ